MPARNILADHGTRTTALASVALLFVALTSSAAPARVSCPRDTPHVGKRYCPTGYVCYQTGVRWRCKTVLEQSGRTTIKAQRDTTEMRTGEASVVVAPEAPRHFEAQRVAAARFGRPAPDRRHIALPSDDFERLGLLCSDYEKCKDVLQCHFGGDGGRTWRFTDKLIESQKKRGFSWAALCLAQNNGIEDAQLIIEQQFWPRAWTQLTGDTLKARIIDDLRNDTPYYEAYRYDGTEYKASEAAAMRRLKARLMRLSVDQLMNYYVDTVEIRDPELAMLVAKPHACQRRGVPLLDCPPTKEGARTYSGYTANEINHILLAVMAAERYGCAMIIDGSAQSARVVCRGRIKRHFPIEEGMPYSIRSALSYTGAIAHNEGYDCATDQSKYCRFERKFLASLNVDRKSWLKRHALPRVQVFVDPSHPKGFMYAINPDDGAAGPGFSATALAKALDGSRRAQIRLNDIINDLDDQ